MKLIRLKKIAWLTIKMLIPLSLCFFSGVLLAEFYKRWFDFCFDSYYEISKHLYTFFSLLPLIAITIVVCVVIAYIKVRHEEENNKHN